METTRRHQGPDDPCSSDDQKSFNTLFEQMPDPAWIIRDHRFIEANAAALKAMGWDDKPAFLALHPADISPERQPDGESSFDKAERIFRSMQDMPVQRFAWTHKHRDGQPALYCVWRDMTEQDRMLASLQASEAYFQALFNDSNEAIMLVGAEGFLDCNPRTLELYGFDSKAEFMTTHPADLSTPVQPDGQDSRTAADARMRAAFETGYQRFEWRHIRRDGTPFDAEVVLSAIDIGERRVLQGIARDISQRKQDEMKLQAFANIIESSNDAIIAKTLDGIITSWNPAAVMMFGYTAEEMIGQPITHIIPPEKVDEEKDFLARIARGETVSHYDTVRCHKEGHRVHVSVTLSPIRDSQGHIVGVSKIAHDVSTQKQLEARLKENSDQLEAIFQNANIGLALSENRLILKVNPALCEMFGYDPSELVGQTSEQLFAAREAYQAPGDEEDFSRMLKGEKVVLELPLRHKNGQMLLIRISAKAIAAPNQGLRIIAILKDITAKNQIEQRNQQLLAVISDSSDFIAMATPQCHIFSVNPQGLRMVGLPLDADLGSLQISNFHTAETYKKIEAVIIPALLEGGHWQGEIAFLHRDGHEIPASCSASLHQDEHGNPVLYSIIARDISVEKSNQEALLAAKQAAETAARAKSQFLAHMSHEIRTPMNAVLGLAQLMEQEPLTTGQHVMLRHIKEAGEALLQIINDILDFSKMEAGQLRIDPQPFTLTSVLNRIEHLLRLSAETKGLRLMVKPLSVHLGMLIGDSVRIQQILTNLVANAIKFTEQGSVILVVSLVTEEPTSVRLRFEIQDSGIGITEAALAKLFQPFSQADAGITRKFGGTGLGLAISRRLVDLMGGEIGATSHPGQGSTFWFELPFTRMNEDDHPPEPIEAEGGKPTGPQLEGLRVLAVDDSRLNLMVVERALKNEGAEVILAADGQQALEILKAQPKGFDVVLMDVQMPVMGGLTATRLIRQEPGLAHLPVIALTAGVLPEEREEAMSAGVNDFLTKPVDLKQMNRLLARFLTRSNSPD